MDLDEKITHFLAVTKTEPARSKLEPYAELIRGLRQRRWTNQKIAQLLRDEFGVIVAANTVFAFVKVRARKREVPAPPVSAAPPVRPILPASPAPRKPRFKFDG